MAAALPSRNAVNAAMPVKVVAPCRSESVPGCAMSGTGLFAMCRQDHADGVWRRKTLTVMHVQSNIDWRQ